MSNARNLSKLLGTDTQITTADIADGVFQANKNLIINGAMTVAQRGTSAFSISTAGNTYTLDRWRANASGGGVFSVQQDSDSPTGFIESSKITVTTADSSIGSSDFYHFRQTIEGYNFSSLGYGASGAKTMTISFYVKSSVTGVYNVLFRNNAGNRGYLTTYAINSANTWERKTITVEGDVTGTWPTDNTGSLIISYSFGGNATATTNQWGTAIDEKSSGTIDLIATLNATWYITGVQLELGDTDTPFEHRNFGDELARCQRYYEKSYEQGTNPATNTYVGVFTVGGSATGSTTSYIGGFGVKYMTEKRSTPTVVVYDKVGNSGKIQRWQLGVANSDNNVVIIDSPSATGFHAYSPSGANASGLLGHYTVDAEV
jgi:hypothetical protein